MAAISIPQEGESFVGERPQVIKVAKVNLGFAAGNDVVITATGTFTIFNVKAGTLVLDVMAYTPTAWTATMTMTIGDAATPAGWLASAKIAPTVAQTDGVRKSSDLPTADGYAGGKLYSVATAIQAVIGTAAPIVGQTDIYIVYIDNDSAL